MSSLEDLRGRQVACPHCGAGNVVPICSPVAPGSAYPTPPRPTNSPYDRRGQAVASLVLGLVALIAWIIPLFGMPITIIGLVLGIKSLKSTGRRMAIAGIVLCLVFLVATLINGVWGAYEGVKEAAAMQQAYP